MTDRVFNFSAGPAVLPLNVLEEAQRDLLALPGVGISILESSHRSPWFGEIIGEAESNLRSLLSIPDSHAVLFLQGGAQLQFSMVPMNFLRGQDRPATYLQTGSWGAKAIVQAAREGETQVAWDGKGDGYVRVPRAEELSLPTEAAYAHITSNETIQGVQFQSLPEIGAIPLVSDCSSDFLSRPIDIARHALIYACAQKNAGPAGATIVIIDRDFMETGAADLHTMLDYRAHAKAGSLFNTPPAFAIYVFLLVTRWLKNEVGGLAAMTELNEKKAALLYDLLDEDGGDFYTPHAETASRSRMNVTFRMKSDELDAAFLDQAKAKGLWSLKGHRSVGGVRASIYNAMPIEGVQQLRDFMHSFRSDNS